MTDSTADDWLSHTMQRVEAVMREHGFEDDAAATPASVETEQRREKARIWSKLLQLIAQPGSVRTSATNQS